MFNFLKLFFVLLFKNKKFLLTHNVYSEQGPVEFEFIKKAQGSNFCKPWLKVTPHNAILMPGKFDWIALRYWFVFPHIEIWEQ